MDAATSSMLGDGPLVAMRGGSWCCLLCERQFKSTEHLEKHLKKSALHRDNAAAASSDSAELIAITPCVMPSSSSGWPSRRITMHVVLLRVEPQPAQLPLAMRLFGISLGTAAVVGLFGSWQLSVCGGPSLPPGPLAILCLAVAYGISSGARG